MVRDPHISGPEVYAIFTSVFSKYEHSLQSFAFKITKSAEQSADIVQEVFLKLWEHRDEMHNIRDMEAWLHRAVKNRLIDYLRKTAADNRLREKLWTRVESAAPNTELLLEAKECNEIIHRAVMELPEQRRLVYQMNRNYGMRHQEIADILTISKHTVKNQLSSAVRTVHRLVSGTLGILLLSFF